ncbi:MAG: glycosyltransferase involved in cell wall biosynthesis [Ilumatobacter sp.]|jgi:glycosyltransferase involved in cell wall biosynthesis
MMQQHGQPDGADVADPPTPGIGAAPVAVNLLWCVPGDVGGSEEYLVRQLLGLAGQACGFVPTLYVVKSFIEAHPALAELYPIEVANLTGVDRRLRVAAEHTWLRRRTRRAELVHHGGGTTPAVGTRPIVLTIHDLQYLTHPEYHSKLKLQYLQRTIPRSVRRARVIATPTDWVRRTVIEEFDVAPDRVVVVPHGVEADIGVGAPSEFELRRHYGLGSGRVIVFPAITHPHKGHEFLLDVMAQYWDDLDLRLVLLGGKGLADRRVTAKIAELHLDRRVIRPGRVPASHRDGLLRLAHAMVFPSEYEGFGAPVIEAMSLDTPVIAAAQPAVSEVIGNAGLVLPRDPKAWADALDVVAEERAELIAAGRRRAADFTAAKSGAALAEAYRLALS